jgi:hypothetical protein
MNIIYSLSLQNGDKLDKSFVNKLKNNFFDMNNPKYKLIAIEDDYYSCILRWKVAFIITKKDDKTPLLALIEER